MFEDIMRFFERIKNKSIKVNQMGFIESEFHINSLKYSIKQDILKVYNEIGINISININQIYRIEKNNKYILLFLDNDTKIKFSEK